MAVAGHIQLAGGTDQFLDRFGAISAMRGIRYWSTSDGAWRPLVSSASALDGPDPARRRAGFAAAELGRGQYAYFVQHDSRSSGGVNYRMRVLESSPDRIVIATENVTPIRLMVVTLFQPAMAGLAYSPPASWPWSHTAAPGLHRVPAQSVLAVGAAVYVQRHVSNAVHTSPR